MPLVENHRIPQIESDLARVKQKIAGRRAGTEGVIPTGFQHINARLAEEKQLQSLYTSQTRLENELIQAKLASGAWSADEIIKRMSA